MKKIPFVSIILTGLALIFSIVPAPGASAGTSADISYSTNCYPADQGSVNIMAEGELSYLNNETIRFSGENSITCSTFLFLLGPSLPPSGVRLTNPAVAVTNNNPATFDVVRTGENNNYYCKWVYTWNPGSHDLDGTYTIYAVSKPLDKNHLDEGKYGSISIIIRAPTTPTPTKIMKPVPSLITSEITQLPTPVQATAILLPSEPSVRTPVKSTIKVPTSWPATTPTPVQESPLPGSMVCVALVFGSVVALLRKR